ncbi:MAG: cell division protein FtsZ [Hyphomicrobium sp.]
MSIKLQLPKLMDLKPRITVIGVGGAGCNAVNNMISSGLGGVDFVVANTDAQALAVSTADHRLQLGVNLTEGLGAGSKPEIGEAAAEEAIDDIRAQITGSHMVFIAGGMGGGTGTGASGVIARVSKELGILTVGIVTKPFHFEGARRMRVAEAGVEEIRKHVDTLIVIPNQNLFRVANEKTTFADAFVLADQVLYSGVACIVDLIIKEGLINLDFADVRTVMSGMGTAVMGTGEASGEGRGTLAAEDAVANPLLDEVSLRGAKGLLLSITGGRDLTLYEVDEAASRVRKEVDSEANIIVGATFDENLGDRVRVSIVASGMLRSGAQFMPAASPSESHARPPRLPQVQDAGQMQVQDSAGPQEEDDLRRRLSEAIGYGDEGGAYQQPDMPPAPQAHEARVSELRDKWRTDGDVVIEEGLSHLSQPVQPPPVPEQQGADATGAAAGNFSPAPPAEIRRGTRRMPMVEDFPPVAQREYRARVGYPPQGPSHDKHAVEEPPRRGLLQRILGRGKRADDAETIDPYASRFVEPHRDSGPPAQDHGWSSPAEDHASRSREAHEEEQEFPVFFNRGRK